MTPRLRFVAHTNVGRLARWLRVMGYDTVFPPEQGDNALACIALHEDRALVTRDGGFVLRRAARLEPMRVAHLTAHDLQGQLRQLIRDWQLNLDEGFSRCMRCNAPLEPVAEFRQCSERRRVFWRGERWASMLAKLSRASGKESL